MISEERKKKDIDKRERYQNKKKAIRRISHDFLLDTYFPENPGTYEEKEVGDYWLIKNKNNDNDQWQVSVYSQEAYKNYKSYTLPFN
tara:strand:+ start:269 stop:529 length:261 start_codon:yes stop_codon:yes gene_type:complete